MTWKELPATKRIGVALGGFSMALLAACGSSGGGTPAAASNSPAADSPGASKLIAEYKAQYKALETNTSPVITIPPLTKPAPTGKTLDIISCAVPLCALYTKGASEAAHALGWKTRTVVSAFTPQGFQETWDTVLQDKPDAVVMAAVAPTNSVIDQVTQASREGVLVVGYGLDVPAGGTSPFTFATTSVAALASAGRVQALAIVDDANGPANALLLNDPSEVNVKNQVAGSSAVFVGRWDRTCVRLRVRRCGRGGAGSSRPWSAWPWR